jgi:hypothetical protein
VCYPVFRTPFPAQAVYSQTPDFITVCHNQKAIVLLLILSL